MLKSLFARNSGGLDSLSDRSRLAPFVVSQLDLCGIPMRLITHEGDRVIGEWVRGARSWSSQDLAEYELLMETAKGARTIVDVGANIGVVSILLSHAAPDAQIYAFEPDPLNFAMARVNLEMNGRRNVNLVNAAISAKTGTINLYHSHDNWGDHRTYAVSADKQVRSSSLEQRTSIVPAFDPAGFFSSETKKGNPFHIDLLKIDTQGSDVSILQHFQPLLRKGSMVSLEFSPEHLQLSGTKEDEVSACLKRAGRIRMLAPSSSAASGWSVTDTNPVELVNYFREGTKGYHVVGYRDLMLEWQDASPRTPAQS